MPSLKVLGSLGHVGAFRGRYKVSGGCGNLEHDQDIPIKDVG